MNPLLDMTNKTIQSQHQAMLKCCLSGRITFSYIIAPAEAPETTRQIDMQSRPCYGELRRYGSRSGTNCLTDKPFDKGTRPNDPHPGDLPAPMPLGKRLALAIRCFTDDDKETNRFYRWFFSDQSHMRNAYAGARFYDKGLKDITDDPENANIAVIEFVNTKVDPTLMVSGFIQHRGYSGDFSRRWIDFVDNHKLSPIGAFIAAMYTYHEADGYRPNFGASYSFTDKLDFARIVQGNPNDLSNGGTWYDEEDYNRPDVMNVWRDNSDTAQGTVNLIKEAVGYSSTKQ